MSQSPNVKLISSFLDKVAKGDVAGLPALLHDGLVWWTAGGELFAGFSGTRGKAEIVEAFGGIAAAFPKGLVLKITNTVEQGDKVAFEAEGYGVTAGGLTYNNTYHIQVTVKDGLIFRVREHMDTVYAKAVLIDGLKVPPAHD